jgi:hypothetical protein
MGVAMDCNTSTITGARKPVACLLVAQNPLDGRSGITTAPVIGHIQGNSGGKPALGLNIRPMPRPLLSIIVVRSPRAKAALARMAKHERAADGLVAAYFFSFPRSQGHPITCVRIDPWLRVLNIGCHQARLRRRLTIRGPRFHCR